MIEGEQVLLAAGLLQRNFHYTKGAVFAIMRKRARDAGRRAVYVICILFVRGSSAICAESAQSRRGVHAIHPSQHPPAAPWSQKRLISLLATSVLFSTRRFQSRPRNYATAELQTPILASGQPKCNKMSALLLRSALCAAYGQINHFAQNRICGSITIECIAQFLRPLF
jgi:hypothetical protein